MLILMLAWRLICSKVRSYQQRKQQGPLKASCLQVVNPVVIFMSYQTEQKPELVRELLLTFALSCSRLRGTHRRSIPAHTQKSGQKYRDRAVFVDIFKLRIHGHSARERAVRHGGRVLSHRIHNCFQPHRVDSRSYPHNRRKGR